MTFCLLKLEECRGLVKWHEYTVDGDAHRIHGGRGGYVVERIRHGGEGRRQIHREVTMDK